MIRYIKGNITDATPSTPGDFIYIPHVVNDLGAMGAGVALALRKKWPQVYNAYNKTFIDHKLTLGSIQIVRVEDSINVVNMVAQKGLISKTNQVPLQYDALDSCLKELGQAIKNYEMISILDAADRIEIHAPKFGAGLAGGSWTLIEKMILKHLGDLTIYIYEL